MERLLWNKLLDRYLTSNTMNGEEYELLDDNQKLVVQEIKRSIKRIYKINETKTLQTMQ